MQQCNEVGGRIRHLREDKGETQAQLAKALQVKRETVNQWENGVRDLKTQYTIDLADHFGVTCDELLRGIKAEHVEICKVTGLPESTIQVLEEWSRLGKPDKNGVYASDMLSDFLLHNEDVTGIYSARIAFIDALCVEAGKMGDCGFSTLDLGARCVFNNEVAEFSFVDGVTETGSELYTGALIHLMGKALFRLQADIQQKGR